MWELFFDCFLTVFSKVALLFIIIALGFVCQKINMLTKEANKCLADIVMYFVTPCVIINAFSSTQYERAELFGILKNIGVVALVSVVLHLFMILAVTFIFRMKDETKKSVMRFGAVFSNAGFIALPLAQALIDTDGSHEGALYAAVFLAVFNIVLWTWGLVDMSGNAGDINIKKIIFNPGVVGVVVGLFLFVSPLFIKFGDTAGIQLPSVLSDAIAAIAALNLPIPMLLVGYYLANADIMAALKDKWSYICIVLRLLLFPLITLGLLYIAGVRGNVLTVCVIGASAPVGATTTIFSAKFDKDAELSVRLVALSTILSIITMPVIVGLTQALA